MHQGQEKIWAVVRRFDRSLIEGYVARVRRVAPEYPYESLKSRKRLYRRLVGCWSFDPHRDDGAVASNCAPNLSHLLPYPRADRSPIRCRANRLIGRSIRLTLLPNDGRSMRRRCRVSPSPGRSHRRNPAPAPFHARLNRLLPLRRPLCSLLSSAPRQSQTAMAAATPAPGVPRRPEALCRVCGDKASGESSSNCSISLSPNILLDPLSSPRPQQSPLLSINASSSL